MPVTARLSSRFYEKLGDEVTNDLVNWLNDVDAEFSKHVTALNDRNWDRFRGQLESTKTDLRADIKTGLADLRTELKTDIANLRGEMHAMKAELIKWMFTFWIVSWIATVVPIAGLILQTR
jgi:hypothetical protein